MKQITEMNIMIKQINKIPQSKHIVLKFEVQNHQLLVKINELRSTHRTCLQKLCSNMI